MTKQWSNSVQLLKWMAGAEPQEIFLCASQQKDGAVALLMCNHAKLEVDDDTLEARIKIFESAMRYKLGEAGVSDLQVALRLAKEESIGWTDTHVKEVIELLNEAGASVAEERSLLDQMRAELSDHIDRIAEDEYEDLEEHMIETLSAGWKTVYLTTGFDDHVQVEGLSTYFANTGGAHAKEILAAFKKLKSLEYSEEANALAKAVRKAFEVFISTQDKHRNSRESRAGAKLNDIVTAENAPGAFPEADELYDEAQNSYLDAAEMLGPLLEEFIEGNPKLFPELD